MATSERALAKSLLVVVLQGLFLLSKARSLIGRALDSKSRGRGSNPFVPAYEYEYKK